MPRLRSLIAYAAPHTAPLALGVALMLLESAAALAVPWLGGKLTAALLQGRCGHRMAHPHGARGHGGAVRRAGAPQVRQHVCPRECGREDRRRPQDPRLRSPAGTAAVVFSPTAAGRHAGAAHARRLRDQRLRERHRAGKRAAAVHRRRRGVLHVPPGAGARAARRCTHPALLPPAEGLRASHPAARHPVERGARHRGRDRRREPRHVAGDQDVHSRAAGVGAPSRADRPHPRADRPAAEDRGGTGARHPVRRSRRHRALALACERRDHRRQARAGGARELPALRATADASGLWARGSVWPDAIGAKRDAASFLRARPDARAARARRRDATPSSAERSCSRT